MGTDGALNLLCLLPLVIALNQGADGTHVQASAAEFTPGLQQGGAGGSSHQGLPGPFREGDGVVAADLLAYADAASADDTEIVVPVVEGVSRLHGKVAVFVFKGRFHFHAQVTNGVLQLASFVLGAGDAAVVHGNVAQADVLGSAQVHAVASQASVRMVGYQQFHHVSAKLVDLAAFVSDLHPLGNGKGA